MNVDFKQLQLKSKRQKFSYLSFINFLILGVIFLVGGYPIASSNSIDNDWEKISGRIVGSSSIITDAGTTYRAVVEYAVDGRSYTINDRVSSAALPQIGTTKEVAFNPSQPSQAKVIVSGGWLLLVYIFPITGVFFLFLGPLLIFRSIKRNKSITTLLRNGIKLNGVIVGFKSHGSGRRISYKITVAATDSLGVSQKYISDSVTGGFGLGVADFATTKIPVDVYVDPTNPRNYYVDIEDIPVVTSSKLVDLFNSAKKRSKNKDQE